MSQKKRFDIFPLLKPTPVAAILDDSEKVSKRIEWLQTAENATQMDFVVYHMHDEPAESFFVTQYSVLSVNSQHLSSRWKALRDWGRSKETHCPTGQPERGVQVLRHCL